MKTLILSIVDLCMNSSASPISVGSKIDVLVKAMAKAKYEKIGITTIDPSDFDSPTSTKWWVVDGGSMSATYDIKSGKIQVMEYVMNPNKDEDDPFGQVFRYRIEWFDSENGKMLIHTRKQTEQGAASDS